MNTISVSNTIIQYFIDASRPIKNMKLQKLLFFLCGYNLAFRQKKLIDDDFEAWPYGPVCPRVYYESKKHEDVNNCISTLLGNGKCDPNLADDAIFRGVMSLYGNHGDWALSNITHQPGTPWSETIEAKGIGGIINSDLMLKFFKEKIGKDPS